MDPKETVYRYIDDVLNDEIVAGRYLKKACQRHLDDLERQETEDFPYYFDEEEAGRVIKFFEFLKHWKGRYADKPLILEPWQQFHLWDLFGWKRVSNDTRRYRTSYLAVGRKNGKTTMAAGVGLYHLLKDKVAGPQAYSIATKRDQSKIVFEDAKNMVEQSKHLDRRVKTLQTSLTHKTGLFRPFSSEDKKLDGFDPSLTIADEVHAHKDGNLIGVMKTGMGARAQPIMYEITTAGYNKDSIGKKHWDYGKKILDGTVDNEQWHVMIFCPDDPEDWENKDEWKKANPNLGVSKTWDHMDSMYSEALEMPDSETQFKTKDLNIWTDSKQAFVTTDQWNACNQEEIELREFRGRGCYAGLDLGSVSDFTSFVLVFPGDLWHVLSWFWIPEDTLRDRENADQISRWARDGWIETTPGDVTDHNYTRDQIKQIAEQVNIKELAYDKFKATEMVTHLMDEGLEMTPFSQGYSSMDPALEEFERLILQEKLNHGGNPVLGWMMSNVVTKKNAGGNRMFDRKNVKDKIDGPVATAMAIGRAVLEGDAGSVYDERGVRSV